MILITTKDFKKFLINSDHKMELVDNKSKNISRIKIFDTMVDGQNYLDSLLYYGYRQMVIDINPDDLLLKNKK